MPEHPTENQRVIMERGYRLPHFLSIIGLDYYNDSAAYNYGRATEGNPWSE
jgi:hypothetical protein